MRKLSTTMMCLMALNAHANVIQYFAGISYFNPSELFKVKKEALILGGNGSYADLKFTGSVLNFNTFQYDSGVNHSRTTTLLPYGRIARRFNEKTVFAVEVTQPFNSNLRWGEHEFTRYANTTNYLRDVDVSPKIGYALGEKLKIGAGLNFNYLLSNEVNMAYPIGPTAAATLVNHSSSFGLGFDLGATYIINQTNFLGITYYSTIKQNTTGYSSLGPYYRNDFWFNFNLPATTIVSYVHIFNPEWLISMQGFVSEWDVNQQIRLYNTAVPAPRSNFVFDMHFKTSYAGLVAVRHQLSEKWGLTLAGMFDSGPEQDTLRTITFPCYDQFFAGLVADYRFHPNATVELMYGHVFSNPPIRNSVAVDGSRIPFTTGQVNINVDVVDLRLKVQA